MAWNITELARRREEGTPRDGGEDGGEAGSPPGRSDQQRMAEMFQYMQSLGAAQGFASPPPLFPTIDLALFHTTVSIKIVVRCW